MKKSTFAIITLVVLTLVVTGCSTNVEQVTPKNQQYEKANTVVSPEEKLLTVNTTASLMHYDSVEKLVSQSTVIVEGSVVGLDYFDFNTNTFTKVRIKVSNSLTNAVKAGDVITFVDAGGITTLDKLKLNNGFEGKPGTPTPITEKDKNTKVQVLFDGNPLLKLNDQVVFFGVEDKDDFYKLAEKYYDPIGSYQGIFIIKGDQTERYSSDGSSSLKMSKLDLERIIRKNVKK